MENGRAEVLATKVKTEANFYTHRRSPSLRNG